MRLIRLATSWTSALLVALACWSCGGGGGGGTTPGGGGTTTPPPTSGTSACAAALTVEGFADVAPTRNTTAAADRKRAEQRGRTKGDVRDALWRHRAPRPEGDRRAEPLDANEPRPAATVDVGDVAVIEDDGTIFLAANPFDLAGTGLRFRPSGASYEVASIDATFRTALGSRLSLGDDDTARVALPSALSFFGGRPAEAFVNSDGNITFVAGDNASTSRSVGRFLGGVPRVAAFFADLDPSAGGRVFANADANGLTVTWCAVPGFDDTNTVTAQATVLTDGTVEIRFGAVTLGEAVVGVSPGASASFAPVDLSAAGQAPGATGAVGERFGTTTDVDLVAAAQRFYRGRDDIYDQLVFWGQTALLPPGEAFAQEFTVANTVRGIGVPVSDDSREFGSSGRLQSIVNMDRILKYPADPAQRFLGEDSVMSLLGQESGHRWLAFASFLDANRRPSNALLGRDDAHWSFFFDSDASVMEGNDIEALGGGAFRTVGAVQRYSLLDQYMMGLVAPNQVPPFFYVEAPANVVPGRDKASSPQVGVTFNGTRRDVLIDDVIAAMGDRQPAAASAPKTWRQAWIYIVRKGSSATSEDVARIDRWRAAWEAFFLQATDGRMRLEARLR
ncbi:MAG: hypothetical protein U0P30_13275 [Vicinamibacterales bacterium]